MPSAFSLILQDPNQPSPCSIMHLDEDEEEEDVKDKLTKQEAERKFKLYVGVMNRNIFKHSGITDSEELDRHGKDLFGKDWLGVFAADEAPAGHIAQGKMYIINNKARSSGGEHWMGCFGTRNGNLLFDSFARSTEFPTRIPGTRTEDDKDQLQSQEDCGQRTMAFLVVCVAYGPKSAKFI